MPPPVSAALGQLAQASAQPAAAAPQAPPIAPQAGASPSRLPANGSGPAKPMRPASDALTRATMAMGANSLPDVDAVTSGRAPARTGPPPLQPGNGQYPPPQIPAAPAGSQPDFSNLPPGVAASLARLAGVKLPEAQAIENDKDGKVPPAA
jgi:hypothetical protein